QEVRFGLRRQRPTQFRTATMPARMLETEASVRKTRRQVFWLTAGSGPRTTFPLPAPAAAPSPLERECGATTFRPGRPGSGASPITAAAPQRIRTVFPFLPRPPWAKEPVETRGRLLAR